MSTSTPSCMFCDSPCNEHTFVIQSNDDDPDCVLEDIQRLDRATHRLHILTAQRYRQLNAIRSLTKALPNEVIFYIFTIFCSLFDSKRSPQFILGGVCSHWRNLINNEPPFWKSLDLTINLGTISRSVSLLEVFKKRNGAFFEFLQLQFQLLHDESNPYQQIVSSIRGVSKLSRIALESPPDDLLQVINNDLTPYDMCLSGPEFIDSLEFLPQFSLPSLPWLALTNLALCRIQVDFCCELLLGCLNLTSFASYCSTPPTNAFTLPSTHYARETHFPHLRHLTWHHGHSAWDNNLLSHYCFPALQSFCWHGIKHGHSLQLFHKFTSFLPQTCSSFHLSAPADDLAELEMEILQQITHPVRRLVCSNFYRFTLPVILQRLQDPTFIPSLTFLRWDYPDLDYREYSGMTREDFIMITQSFKDAIRGRKEIGAGGFRMEIEDVDSDHEFSKESWYESMGGGFDFEIAENGCWTISF